MGSSKPRNLGSKVKCPICSHEGYLTTKNGKYLRITHNEEKVRHCYLGSPDKFLARLEHLSMVFPEKSLNNGKEDPELKLETLVEKIKKYIPEEKKKELTQEAIQIIQELRKVSEIIGPISNREWKSRTPDNCPHCKKRIAIYLQRHGYSRASVGKIWLDTWKYY